MVTKLIFRTFFLFFLAFLSSDGFAADRFWVAASSGSWNNSMNWSTSSGGAPGASVPGSSDSTYFDNGSTFNCTIDISANVNRITIQGTYSGTITVNPSMNLTMNTYVQSGGTFTGSNGNVEMYGGFNLSGGVFNAPSAILKLGGAYSRSGGTFNHNNGTVYFASNIPMAITGSTIFSTLQLGSNGSDYNIAAGTTLTSLVDLAMVGGGSCTINTGTIAIEGNLTLNANSNNSANGGTGTFLFNGTGVQNITSSITSVIIGTNERSCGLPNVEINKVSGSLNLSGVISMRGATWKTTAGATLVNPGTSTLNLGADVTFSGQDLSLYNIHIWAAFQTITLSPATYKLTATNNITVNGGGFYKINTGILELLGDLTLISTANNGNNGGTGTLLIDGTGVQNITSSATAANFVCALPSVSINKASGALNLSGFINFAGSSWNTVAGASLISQGTSTVNVLNSSTISGQNLTLYNITISGNYSTVVISTGVMWTSTNLITFAGGPWYQVNTGTLNAKGNVLVTCTDNSWNVGGNAVLLFDGTANQLLTGSGTIGAGRLPHVKIDKTGGVLTLASPIISTDNNWTYVQGTVDALSNASTISFHRTSIIDGQGTSATMTFNNVIFSGAITLGGNLDANGNLTIANTYSDWKLDASSSNYRVNLAGNWINNNSVYATSFEARNGKVVFDGPAAQQLTLASGAHIETFNELEMNNTGGGLTLNGNIVVTSNCNFITGRIYSTASSMIRIDNNATATGASNTGYVSGPIRKTGNQAFVFPVGKNDFYASIAMSAPSAGTDEFTCEYFYVNPDPLYNTNLKESTLNNISQCEYWILDRTTGSANVTVRPSWDTRSCGVTNLPDLKVARWDGGIWRDHGNGGTTGNTTAGTVVTASNVSNFSPFTLASSTSANPLPIELSYFDATCENEKAVIEWTTESEKNNSYFTIENSQDGQNWEVLATIPGAGNSLTPQNYRFVNEELNNGFVYYRLRQTDSNGSYDFSSIEYLESCSEGSAYSFFPNPTTGIVSVNHPKHIDLSISIVTVTGQLARQYNHVAETIDISDLPDGVYFIRMSTNNNLEKLVKRSN